MNLGPQYIKYMMANHDDFLSTPYPSIEAIP